MDGDGGRLVHERQELKRVFGLRTGLLFTNQSIWDFVLSVLPVATAFLIIEAPYVHGLSHQGWGALVCAL